MLSDEPDLVRAWEDEKNTGPPRLRILAGAPESTEVLDPMDPAIDTGLASRKDVMEALVPANMSAMGVVVELTLELAGLGFTGAASNEGDEVELLFVAAAVFFSPLPEASSIGEASCSIPSAGASSKVGRGDEFNERSTLGGGDGSIGLEICSDGLLMVERELRLDPNRRPMFGFLGSIGGRFLALTVAGAF